MQPILIVGAGPVGLVAALRLAAQRVPVLLVERELALPQDLRASTFHPPTLEMLDEPGLTASLLARGLRTPTWQVRWHETGEKAEFDLAVLADDTRYPFRLQVEQRVLCALAAERARAEPLIDLRFGCELVSLTQDADGVDAVLRDAQGAAVTVRTPYLLGCDGARSTARNLLGLGFEGLTYPETTILATTTFPFEDHLPGLSNVNYCWYAQGTFSLLKLPDTWRVSLYADEGESAERAATPQAVAAKLQRIVPTTAPYPIGEVRPYRIHQRILDDYRVGRVLLAGDAAHLNSPSGGMGMNGGIHDAWNLTEKLPRVLRGEAPDALLDAYTTERRVVALDDILRQAHANRLRMQQRDPVYRRTELTRLQAIAADPEQAREHLLRTSMISGLRRAAA